MSTEIVRNGPEHEFPGGLKEILISCDQLGCDVTINDTIVREGGGLTKMGWQAVPAAGQMEHYCPAHPRIG